MPAVVGTQSPGAAPKPILTPNPQTNSCFSWQPQAQGGQTPFLQLPYEDSTWQVLALPTPSTQTGCSSKGGENLKQQLSEIMEMPLRSQEFHPAGGTTSLCWTPRHCPGTPGCHTHTP